MYDHYQAIVGKKFYINFYFPRVIVIMSGRNAMKNEIINEKQSGLYRFFSRIIKLHYFHIVAKMLSLYKEMNHYQLITIGDDLS